MGTDIYLAISIMATCVTVVIALGGLWVSSVRLLNKTTKRFEQVEKSAELRCYESKLLFRCLMAMLSWFSEHNGNGQIKKVRDDIEQHLINHKK